MDELLQEFVDWRDASVRVDREQCVLRGVKLVGLGSCNRRVYQPDALRQAVGLYEGAKVNVNHPKNSPLAARDYQERIGLVRNVLVREGEGLFGDLHYNPKHALAEQLVWDAEHAPQNVGLSHNVLARTARQGDNTVVEAILKVQSVDLVADPATTRGLFENRPAALGAPAEPDKLAAVLAVLTLDQLHATRPDLVEAVREATQAELVSLREQLEGLRTADAARVRRDLVRRLLAEHGLPDPDQADATGRALVGQSLLEALAAAPNEMAMRTLVAERARLIHSASCWAQRRGHGAARPQCVEQRLAEAAVPELDAATFARLIS